MLKHFIASLAIVGAFASYSATSASAESKQLTITVKAGEHDRENTPVKAAVALPPSLASGGQVKLTLDGKTIPAQLAKPSLLAKPTAATGEDVPLEIVFVLPRLPAGETAKLKAEIASDGEPAKSGKSFAWNDTAGKYTELSHGGLPILRYMYAPLDESSKEARHATMKPFHHVFDPATGKTLLTKGPGGLFPHHRGLFLGFNKISYGEGKKADTWHCNNGEFTAHHNFASQEAGPVLGRHVANIKWFGQKADQFASEQREMTVYHLPGGTLIEFADRLSSEVGPIKLDGDPQHAGFQFRATQEVPDKTKDKTYYLRPDGKGQPGKFRNWPGDKGHVDLPWNALSMVVGDQRYTVAMLDRPENPKEARFSERDYGRFGSYFEYELDTDKPLELNYRVWVQLGEMDVEGVQRLADDFVEPVEVTVE